MAEQGRPDAIVCSDCRNDAERIAHDVSLAPTVADLDPETRDVLRELLFGPGR